MFDWFYEFLYSISKTIFRLVDGLMLCANKLCGIEPVNFNGEETDFLTYLLFSDSVSFAFRTACVLAIILLFLFSVFAVIRTITKEKAEGTPAQICVKTLKTFLTFLFVPAVMLAFVMIGNAFMSALYQATIQGASTTGNFLFCAFAQDGGMTPENLNEFYSGAVSYTDTSAVAFRMDLSEYPFIFSWLASGVILFCTASSMFMFIDRVISIVILYIVSPFSIATTVIDDGARFKLWRDQLLTKFIMGYGMIIALNVYAMICGLVLNPNFSFFESNSFLNLIMKLLVIGGGALTLKKSMAIIGNLVSQGAGSNELRDNAVTAGGLAKTAGGLAATALGLGVAKGVLGSAIDSKKRDWGEKMLKKVGLGIDDNRTKSGGSSGGSDESSRNGESANYGNNGSSIRDAINGGAGQNGNNSNDGGANMGDGNQNGVPGGLNNQNAVNRAINGEGFKTSWGRENDE